MKFSATTLLVALVGSTSAIDLYFHADKNCGGEALTIHRNVNPVDCPSYGKGAGSIAIRGIPTNWNVQFESYTANGCGWARKASAVSKGASFLCLKSDEAIRSGRYFFARD